MRKGDETERALTGTAVESEIAADVYAPRAAHVDVPRLLFGVLGLGFRIVCVSVFYFYFIFIFIFFCRDC